MTDLKLIALDPEDLEVISTHLQDAVVRVGDIGFARGDHRFALLLNRYDWESDAPRKKGLRKRTALHFDAVKSASSAGFDTNARDGVLALLAITFAPNDNPSGVIELSFAGGATIRLHVDYLEARMTDLGATWAAKARPVHAID